MSSWSMFSFQDPMTPIMEQLIMFNDHAMMMIIIITVTVMYVHNNVNSNKSIYK